MQREHLNRLALVLALTILSGCVHTLPSLQIATAQVPAAPVPIAPPPVLPDWTPAPEPDVAFMDRHVVVHRRFAHGRYATRARYGVPHCGSIAYPCHVEHVTVPIQ